METGQNLSGWHRRIALAGSVYQLTDPKSVITTHDVFGCIDNIWCVDKKNSCPCEKLDEF